MPSMEPQIEYAIASDGVRIATLAFGAGPPLLITATPPWSHVQFEYNIPAVRAWSEALGQHARVIRYDSRGTGLSDRDAFDLSLESQLRDLEAVVDHHDLDRFVIWGSIGGSPAAIAYAESHPDRATHLLLWGAYARAASFLGRPDFRALTSLLTHNWELFADAYAQGAFGWADSATAEQYSKLMRASLTHQDMITAMRQMTAIDVTEQARALTTPCLVLTRRDAKYSGVREAREMASLIPGARLLVLEGSAQAPFLGDTAPVIEAVRAFMASDEKPHVPRRAAATLTGRETQVLRLLAGGRSGKEIAAELAISLPTAQRHIANIYAKIGARGRVEAAAYAFEHRLVSPSGTGGAT